MNRETLSLCIFSALSLAVTSGVYHWLDTHPMLNAEQAAGHAQQIIDRLYTNAASKPQLVNMTAPGQSSEEWRFEYLNGKRQSLTVTVQENGQARLI